MISKKLFVDTIHLIQKQDIKNERFSQAPKDMCDGYPTFNSDNGYLTALRDLLAYEMQDESDMIGWWLYEDVEKKVCWEESGQTIEKDLTRPEDLYDSLLEKSKRFAIPENRTLDIEVLQHHVYGVLNSIEKDGRPIKVTLEGEVKFIMIGVHEYAELTKMEMKR